MTHDTKTQSTMGWLNTGLYRDIKYSEEIRQADRDYLMDKLTRLQAKARRKHSISIHGHPRDRQSEGSTASQTPQAEARND